MNEGFTSDSNMMPINQIPLVIGDEEYLGKKEIVRNDPLTQRDNYLEK